MSQQLVKKGANGKHENVMPRSWIEAIKDKNTGQTLVEILQGFNMYFLPYNGNTSATRCLVPTMLRKKGLWITYVKYDGNVYTEWYAADEIDDKSWGGSSNWRVGNNTLVGDITISANGNWVINGTETEFKAIGEKGNTPLIRVTNNRLQVSYDLGDTYIDVSNNPVYTKFRWLATSGDTQANNVGRIQASTDEGKTWSNMSNDFINNLHISRYIGVSESLPTSGIAEGTIYAKGPYYAEDDTLNDNPIYRLWVYAWKGDTLAWQDNGEFTSIAAGVVQETGNSETAVMSQKAVSEKLTELELKLSRSIALVDYIDGNNADIKKYNIGDYIYMTGFPTKYFYKKTEDLWEQVDCKTADVISFNGESYIFNRGKLEKVFSEIDAIEQKQSIEENFEKQLYGDNPTFHLVGYLNTEGVFVSNISFKSTDYIACEQGYYISGIASENPGTCTYAFYDNQKNFLIGHTGPENVIRYEFKNIEIPIGAAFVRVCAVESIYAEVEIRPSLPFVELINKSVLVDTSKTLLQPAKVVKGNFIDKNGNYVVNASHDVNVYVYDDKYNYYIENAAGYVGCCMGWDEEFLGYIPDLWDINPNNLEGRRYPFPIGTAYLFVNNSSNSLIVLRTPKTNYDKGYHTCVNKPIDWSGKTAIFFGDSITRGYASVWGGQQFVSDNNYPNLVAAKLNLGRIRNEGIGGSCLAIREAATNNTPGVELIAGTDKKIQISEDVIFVAFGTNDCSVEIPIGKIDDMPTSASEARTFFGALNYISNTFDQEYAEKIVVFILPIWRRTYSDKAPLDEYRKAIFAVATSRGYNVVDGSQFGFPADYRKLIADLTHPTELGYKLYAQQLYNELV